MSALLPAPVTNPDSQQYWQGAQDERLLIRKCKFCGVLHFMPRYLCPSCWSTDLEWIQASGRGTVHSYSVIRRASDPEFSDRVPYVVALIDLEEGPRMMANILGDDALDIRIGHQVAVCFEERAGGAKVPQFRRSASKEEN
ncbi:Zn-ribbon domain-containing OB-fold protein [Lacisediminimonas profundi]|uniref:Zn-ribbon domain-containing OB-fold protein n=1 Tax=Lacisediminimonas profundi TaxID=2603856 RepID=UPI00124BAB9B|nr:Zn-ribbon domain-containing OB-fold protein [Lacisediminimonas profundi]